MSPPPENKSKTQLSTGSNGDGAYDSSPPPAASLEQSVKMFRIFEALRSGDTTAISKAIKEQNDASALSSSNPSSSRLEGTTILHLAIQCAETSVIEFVLSNIGPIGSSSTGINAQDKEGNTPLHLAARTGRAPVVQMLLDQDGVNDSLSNFHGQTALDLAYSPEIFQQLQLARSLFIDANVRKVHELVSRQSYTDLEKLLNDPRIRSTVDVNGNELATERTTIETGGTLLHEAARKKDLKLIQLLLMNGADPFRRDRKGKLPQDVTKDEKTRHILKKSPAAEAAQRSVQERTILGGSTTQLAGASTSTDSPLGGKESREMKGYLKKWTNYSGGWKLRWFVLEEGVLSYYKHQGDTAIIFFTKVAKANGSQMMPVQLVVVLST
jgi:ankyrin repeat protein